MLAVFPIDEAAIHAVNQLRADIADDVTLVMAEEHCIETCLDKSRMLQVCDEVGVDYAPFQVVDSADQIREACDEVGLPVVIKPLDEETIWFGKKAVIVQQLSDLKELSQRDDLAKGRLIIQRYATGPRHNVYFAAIDGEIVHAAEVKIERTDRFDGTGLAVAGRTIEPTPLLAAATTKLTASLRYSGVGCAQYLLDPVSERSSFLELNPRLGANFAAVHYAGVPLAELAVQICSGVDFSRPSDPWSYRRGLKFTWTYGELAGCRFEYRQGNVGAAQTFWRLVRCGLDALLTRKHITWAWSDPLPTIAEFRRALLGGNN